MDPMIAAWASAFAFTQLVEIPVYHFGARVGLPLAFGASAVTHPIVWFVFFSPAIDLAYEPRVVLAEVFAVVAEAAMLSTRLPRRRAIGFSLLANASSVVLGELSRTLTGMP